MEHSQIREIAEAAADVAVIKTLTALGFDAAHPLEMQADMAHVRFWRKAFQGAMTKIAIVAIVAVFGIVGLYLTRNEARSFVDPLSKMGPR